MMQHINLIVQPFLSGVKRESKKTRISRENKPFAPLKNIKTFLHNTSYAVHDALNELIFLADRFNKVDPSQTYMAIKSGVCRQTTNEAIQQLVSNGIIQTESQGYMKTLKYYVNPRFFQFNVRKELKNLLPALSTPSLTGLLLHDPTLFTQYVYDKEILERKKNKFYKLIEKKISYLKDKRLRSFMQKCCATAIKYATKRLITGFSGTTNGPPVLRPSVYKQSTLQKEPKKGGIIPNNKSLFQKSDMMKWFSQNETIRKAFVNDERL
jgi:hypothetical protein